MEIPISIITRSWIFMEFRIFMNIVKGMKFGWKIVLCIKYYANYTWNITLWLF